MLNNNATNKKSVLAGMIGTMIEWYDYGLFGYLAPVIAEIFFPAQNKWISLLQALMVFSIGFMLRPIGGLIFGSIADRFGRVIALRSSILLISLPSILIACLPPFSVAGYISTSLLIFLRLIQGLSVGGEFAGSMVYLTEISPPRFRTLFSGLANNASNIGILFGVGICTLLSTFLSHDMFFTIGWRIPFLLGGTLGIVGYYLRKYFLESDAFLQLQKQNALHAKPISILFKKNFPKLLLGVMLCCMGACSIYTLTSYISTYLQIVKHYPLSTALSLQSILLSTTLILVPLASLLANQIGRINILKIAALGNILFSVLVFAYIPENNIELACLLLMPLIIFVSIEQGVMPSTLANFFPTAIRYTAVAISYNVSYAYVGGAAPMYITWLIEKTHNPLIPGLCILIASSVTGFALMIIDNQLRLRKVNNDLNLATS